MRVRTFAEATRQPYPKSHSCDRVHKWLDDRRYQVLGASSSAGFRETQERSEKAALFNLAINVHLSRTQEEYHE
jgi:hypothetical protein